MAAGRLGVQGHPCLHIDFKVSLGSMRLSLKKFKHINEEQGFPFLVLFGHTSCLHTLITVLLSEKLILHGSQPLFSLSLQLGKTI